MMMELPKKTHVLLVADCPEFREFFKDHLQRHYCAVTVVDNTSKALELMTTHKEMSFDFLIVNIDMPSREKFQRLELVHTIRILPVIMLSKSHNENMIMKAYARGSTVCLTKSIQIEDLKDIWSFIKKPNDINAAQKNNISLDIKDHKHEGSINEDLNGKTKRKCDEPDDSKDKEQDKDRETACLVPPKKPRPRLVWTDELKNKFDDAVNKLGIHKATPNPILRIMNVPYLTRENVASHLQKYKNNLKTMDTKFMEQKARTAALINNMIPLEPRSATEGFIEPSNSIAPAQFKPQGLHAHPSMNITMSQGNISSNISGHHLAYPLNSNTFYKETKNSRPSQINETLNNSYPPMLPQRLDQPIQVTMPQPQYNEAYLQQIPTSEAIQVLPFQEDSTAIMEPSNGMVMSLNSELDANSLQITTCDEKPSTEVPTPLFIAKSGLESPLESQLQYQDDLIKAMPSQQVTQSSLGHFYEHSTNNRPWEPRLQFEHAPTDATPLIKGPHQEEGRLKHPMTSTSEPTYDNSLNNESLKTQSQYQQASIDAAPLISRQEDQLKQIISSILGQYFDGHPINNRHLEPQLQCQVSTIDPQPLIEVPSQQEDSLNRVTPNASGHSCEKFLNNGPLVSWLQYQDSLMDAPPLIEIQSQPEGCKLCTPNTLDSHYHPAKNGLEPDDSSLDGSLFLPEGKGFGEEDKFADEILKLMSELGSTTQVEKIDVSSMDFD